MTVSTRFPSGNLGDIIAPSAQADSGYIDLADGRKWTLAELDDLAGRLSATLARRYEKGSTIALAGANGAPFFIACLAVMRAGLVAAPINYRLPTDTINYILGDCSAVAIFADEGRRSLALPSLDFLDLNVQTLETHAEKTAVDPFRPSPADIAEILYTSGSTGRPKGVPLTHAGQIWALDRFLDIMPEGVERTIIVAPTYHMNGFFFTTVALACGWRVWSMPKFDARIFLETAAENRCTILSGVPPMFAMMAREDDLLDRLDMSSVKQVIVGSAPLTDALLTRIRKICPNAEIRNSYGTTETGPAMFGPHPDGTQRPALAIGYPYPDVEWRLVNGYDQDEGVLQTRTPALTPGYLNLPEVTRSRIDSDGWYDTGDVVRRDQYGFFHYVGRADDMFICGGENVYPGEIEKLLERHTAVLEAAVVPVDDELKGQIPVAFIVAAPGATVTPEDVKAYALANGPAYAHPRIVIPLERMPVNGAHKIDKNALKPLAQKAADTRRTDVMAS